MPQSLAPAEYRSPWHLAFLTLGLALFAVGGYVEVGALAAVLTVGAAVSWLLLPAWYAFALSFLAFSAAAQSPGLVSLSAVTLGLVCALVAGRIRRSETAAALRGVVGVFAVGLLVWWTYRSYADVRLTTAALGVASAFVFYSLHRYLRVEMSAAEGYDE